MPMKKMPAFFSWVPGRCREATEEGKKCLSVPLDKVCPADECPHFAPIPQASVGFSFVFSAIFATAEIGRYLWSSGVNTDPVKRHRYRAFQGEETAHKKPPARCRRFFASVARWDLHNPLRQHRIGYFLETGDVCAVHIVGVATFRTVRQAVFVDVRHDVEETFIHFFTRP